MASLLHDDAPTEVHDSVLPVDENLAQPESVVSDQVDQSPMLENQQDVLTMNSATSESFSQPVEDLVISSA